MELHFLTLLFALAGLLLLLAALKKPQNSDKTVPPGPSRLPVIGSMHHLWGQLPQIALFHLAEKHGPLMLLRLGQIDLLVASSPAAAEAILKTHDINFASRPDFYAPKIATYGFHDFAFAPYGEHWRQMRKICVTEVLSVNRVKCFTTIREDETNNVIRSIKQKPGSIVNLHKVLMMLANSIISRAAFGSKCQHQEKFLVCSAKLLELATGFTLADMYPSYSNAISMVTGLKFAIDRTHKALDKIFDEIIAEHEEKAKNMSGSGEAEEEDVVDVLLKIKERGTNFPFAVESIKAVILDLFVAATDTSSTTIEWAMTELVRNPEVMLKAQSEVRATIKGKPNVEDNDVEKLTYLHLVIKETLRMHPSLPMLLPRVCREECEVLGYTIPTKTRVLVNAWALGRDPKYWDEPDRFRPERFEGNPVDFKSGNFEYIPFGAGRRMCPGVTFGMANVGLELAQLLFHFDWQLPNGMKAGDVDMSYGAGISAIRKKNLCLHAYPYVPSTVAA